MASNSKPHVRGSMDIREHKKTYEAFWSVTQWSTIGITLLLILLAWLFV